MFNRKKIRELKNQIQDLQHKIDSKDILIHLQEKKLQQSASGLFVSKEQIYRFLSVQDLKDYEFRNLIEINIGPKTYYVNRLLELFKLAMNETD